MPTPIQKAARITALLIFRNCFNRQNIFRHNSEIPLSSTRQDQNAFGWPCTLVQRAMRFDDDELNINPTTPCLGKRPQRPKPKGPGRPWGLTHLFTHLSLTVTRTPHSRTLCVSRHSSCVKGFAFVCTPKNVRGPAWRLCVVAFAARLLGSAARRHGLSPIQFRAPLSEGVRVRCARLPVPER